MPVISVDPDELTRLSRSDELELIQTLPKLGIEIKRTEGKNWDLEIFPDRCDMLSVEGIARSVRGYLEKDVGLPIYDVETSDLETDVKLSVQDVRPYIVTALIEDVKLTDALLKSLMDVQEKLHLTLGRDRSKVAIGIHDFDKVKPPFTYEAVMPSSVEFVPLGKKNKMDLEEILEKHEKGQEFKYILEGKERYPLITDSKGDVLSFPPIINGVLTEVTSESKTLFIDMTGTDLTALENSLNILCSLFAERGCTIKSTTVSYGGSKYVYPDLSPEVISFSYKEAEKLLGIELGVQKTKKALERMRYGTDTVSDEEIVTLVPPYRVDILHPWDLIEDIAIGYGYHLFEGEMPKEPTMGKPLEQKKLEKAISELLVGYGYTEVMNFTLSSPEVEGDMMRVQTDGLSLIENPVTDEGSCLRKWLLPSLMSNLRSNRKHPLPQKFYEIGDVVYNNLQETRAAGVHFGAEVGFTDIKSLIQGLMEGLGIDTTIEPRSHQSFIEGRCASIRTDDKEIGFFGEIHPEIISNFGLEHPTVGFEIYLERL